MKAIVLTQESLEELENSLLDELDEEIIEHTQTRRYAKMKKSLNKKQGKTAPSILEEKN